MEFSLQNDFGGVWPSGPFSLYPYKRHMQMHKATKGRATQSYTIVDDRTPDQVGAQEMVAIAAQRKSKPQKVNASLGKMASGLVKTAAQAAMHGKVSEEIRNERYDTCKNCPFFVEDSKRCSECGCFMEAKTWVGGDPNMLCPKKKWSR